MQSAPRPRRLASPRLEHQTPTGHFPSDSGTGRLAGFGICLHDGEEIGPKMLARIAKHAGLQLEDR
jgi:hypothetical protein